MATKLEQAKTIIKYNGHCQGIDCDDCHFMETCSICFNQRVSDKEARMTFKQEATFYLRKEKLKTLKNT